MHMSHCGRCSFPGRRLSLGGEDQGFVGYCDGGEVVGKGWQALEWEEVRGQLTACKAAVPSLTSSSHVAVN